MLAIAQKLGFKDLKSFQRQSEDQSKAASRFGRCAARRLPRLSDAHAGQAARSSSAACPRRPLKWLPVPDYLEKTSAPAYYEARHARRQPPRTSAHRHLQRHRSQSLPGRRHRLSRRHSRPSPADLHRAGTRRSPGIPQVRAATPPISEGWGLYAERLGKDVGFYQDPYSDYGRLEGDIWRAIRLVVDTGVHSQALDPRADGRLLPRPLGHRRDQHSGRSGPLHRVAQPGAGLQDRPVARFWNCATARRRRWATSSIFAPFTTRCSTPERLPLDVLSDRIDAWIASQK